jgi:hypothetical protein
MQYILTEQEMNRGCELIESWTEEHIPIGEVYIRTEELNQQGYFTVVSDFENDQFRITVFQRSNK